MPWIEPERQAVPPHPRSEPRFAGTLTPDHLRAVFADCADFDERAVCLGGDPHKPGILFTIIGQVRTERLNDYVLRPLTNSSVLAQAAPADLFRLLVDGVVYCQVIQTCGTLDEAAFAMINGSAVLAIPDEARMIAYVVPTEEKRSLSPPQNEPAIKGAKDAFVESLRTNTSLVRRRLRAPELKIRETLVGRQSVTPVDVVYLDGIAAPELVRQVWDRVSAIDTDALLEAAALEEQITDSVRTAFPLVADTERPDRFCTGLTEGRVGVLVDGIPQGYLLPGTVGQFFETGQDLAQNWIAATCLSLLRYLCMLTSLLFPAGYVAAVRFHPEMIPARLAGSIAAAKADVPFTALFEVLILLLAFEILQEAGLRLPGPVGQTVSILGGLVVGSAAVEAKIVSPVVLIVVAAAGTAGYTVPSRAFSDALRLWRFLLVGAAALGGLFGIAGGLVILVGRLARMESFGVPYLAPFTAGRRQGHGVIRWPIPWVKLRPGHLSPKNRRRQG